MEWKEKCFRILKILLLDITILYCFFSFTGNVQAATHSEQEKDVDQQLQETMDGYLEELDFSDIDTMLEQQDGTEGLNFKGLVEKLVNGEEIDKGWLLDELLSAVFSEVAEFRGTLVQMVLLCIVFAILYNFANVFENPSVTEISFYMVYMLLLVLLMRSFFILRDISITVISHMMDFLKVMIPTFTASMAFSGQITTAAGFYDLTFILIYALEWLMKYLIIPAVQIYVALELINHLTEEDMISRMTALVKSGILWCMKCLFTIVVGINVVQNLLTPVIDTFKSGIIAKTAGLVPGLGTSINAVTEIMVGSGIIIKNGIGVAAILILLVLCSGPLIKVWVMTFLYKLLEAMIQPVADKRMIGCIGSAGEGGRLLGKVVVTTTVMFLVTIAMITAATTFHR
ncbi:stage III sporulation protein AE [Lachnospiraceae bacterium 66-29]